MILLFNFFAVFTYIGVLLQFEYRKMSLFLISLNVIIFDLLSVFAGGSAASCNHTRSHLGIIITVGDRAATTSQPHAGPQAVNVKV